MTWLGLGSHASLSVQTLQTKYFTRPLAKTDDPIVHGVVTLTLKKPKKVDFLCVSLLGLYNISFTPSISHDDRHYHELIDREGKTLENTVRLEIGEEPLPAGPTAFRFILTLPARTAVQQRTVYGRIRHKVLATASVEGTVVTGQQMLQINALPSQDACPPPPLQLDVQDHIDDIGPMSISFSSAYFAIGAPLETRFTMHTPPYATDIVCITLNIVQSFDVDLPDLKARLATQRWRVFLADAEHDLSRETLQKPAAPKLTSRCVVESNSILARAEAGAQYTFRQVMRLPNDDHVRPTTMPPTESPIRATHHLELDVAFRQQGGPLKHLVVSRPVTIASCCCLLADITLPQYSQKPVAMSKELKQCICGATVQDFVEESGLSVHGVSDLTLVPIESVLTLPSKLDSISA